MLNTSPPHSEDEQEQLEAVVAIESADQSVDTEPAQKPSSRGQFLLPLLFAAMETCWIDAIFIGLADTDALGTTRLVFPLWLPFVLIGSFYILSSYQRWYAMDSKQSLHYTGRTRKRLSASTPVNLCFTVIATLFTVWISYYAPQTVLTDSSWLLNLPGAILQFTPDSFRLLGTIALAIAFCRQGSLLVRGRVNHALISKLLQSGIFTFILLLVIRKFLAVIGHVFDDELTVLCLIVLYLCLSLATHALARVGVVRRHYSVGQKNELIRQERVTLQSVILASSILLAIALGTGAILNATLIRDTGVLFFKSDLFNVPSPGNAKILAPCGTGCFTPVLQQKNTPVHQARQQPANTLFSNILIVLSIILFLAIVVFIIVLVIKLVHWWRKRERPEHRWELHESLWSWFLFWQQFKSFMHTLLSRFTAFTVHSTSVTVFSLAQDRQAPTLRDISAIYHAFLTYAASQGYPRKNYETPYEFSIRMAQQYPLIEPHLTLITSAYVTTRYAGTMLKPEDVAATHYAWVAMQQNWQ